MSKERERIDCIECAYSEIIMLHLFSPMENIHHPGYPSKGYLCKEITPGVKVLIEDPKNPPKRFCPCYTRGLKWKSNSLFHP
jgi:hypothetical protein